jgi:hypothetical protein
VLKVWPQTSHTFAEMGRSLAGPSSNAMRMVIGSPFMGVGSLARPDGIGALWFL